MNIREAEANRLSVYLLMSFVTEGYAYTVTNRSSPGSGGIPLAIDVLHQYAVLRLSFWALRARRIDIGVGEPSVGFSEY
jgi:hypothetical protein